MASSSAASWASTTTKAEELPMHVYILAGSPKKFTETNYFKSIKHMIMWFFMGLLFLSTFVAIVVVGVKSVEDTKRGIYNNATTTGTPYGWPSIHGNPNAFEGITGGTNMALSDSILQDLNTTISRFQSGSKDLNNTASLSPRNYPPTVPDCTPNGPVCRLSVATWDSPGHSTAVLGIFDWYCNLIGYNDHAPIGQVVDLYSQLPYTVVTEVSGVNEVVFKYAGAQYGTGWTQAICWEEPTPQFGFPAYCVVPFRCPPK